jgi:hypothetical protein
MKIRTLVCAAAAAVSTSCLPVPFDLGLSQSAALTKKMTQDNSSLITLNGGIDSSAHDFVFYPQILATGPDYADGFVASVRSLNLSFSAVQYGPSSGTYNSYSMQSFPVPNPDPHAPAFAVWPLKAGSSYLLGFAFDALDPANGNGYGILWGDPFTQTLTQAFSGGLSGVVAVVFPGATLIGASVSADPSATFDLTHWIGNDGSVPPNYEEFSIQVGSTGLGATVEPRGAAPYPLPFIPNGLTRVTFFYDENQGLDPVRFPNRSFASWWDTASGSWVGYAWSGPAGLPPTQNMRLPINHRLDALLSTGQLLSTEGGTGRLYDRDGNLLATFPLGNLVYIGEHYVGGVPRCYFSQSLSYDQTQHFNVYWIRTDQLSTLAN